MRKEHWFKISLVILPVIILLLIEIFLRIFDLYTPEPLFISINNNNTELYQLNTEVANRYFNKKLTTIPNLLPETFTKYKDEKTIRIFCMGGSTTAGFPFDYQIPFPFQLRKILEAQYPEYKFEVLNMGISAVNSFTVLDFIPDILSVEPDYIIIYMGHNEFYGAYGSASTMSGGMSGGLIRFYFKLKKLHLVTMLEKVIRSFAEKPETNGQDRTLMELVIRDKDIEYDSDIYNNTILNFEENVNQIAKKCKDKNVPIIMGNLVCNLKDQSPFQSSNRENNSDSRDRELLRFFDNVLSNPVNKRIEEINKNTDLTADDYFSLANHLLDSGDSVSARFCYSKARDLDLIRFRASDDINQIINNLSDREITIVNLDSIFQGNAEYGIPGNELFIDHLHPTPHGYYIMANAFAKCIQMDSGGIEFKHYPRDAQFITDLDMDMGLLKIFNLKHHWPFGNKEFNFKNYKPFGNPKAAEFAYDFIFKHFNWSKAHYQMADYYISSNLIQNARKEYEAVNYYYTDLADPLFKIAETYTLEKNWQKAEKYYLESLGKTSNKGLIYKALANSQWKQHKMVKAVNTVQQAIVAFNNDIKHQTQAKFMLANMLIDMKRPNDSIMILKDLLKFAPKYQPAIQMLKQLNSN